MNWKKCKCINHLKNWSGYIMFYKGIEYKYMVHDCEYVFVKWGTNPDEYDDMTVKLFKEYFK